MDPGTLLAAHRMQSVHFIIDSCIAFCGPAAATAQTAHEGRRMGEDRAEYGSIKQSIWDKDINKNRNVRQAQSVQEWVH